MGCRTAKGSVMLGPAYEWNLGPILRFDCCSPLLRDACVERAGFAGQAGASSSAAKDIAAKTSMSETSLDAAKKQTLTKMRAYGGGFVPQDHW